MDRHVLQRVIWRCTEYRSADILGIFIGAGLGEYTESQVAERHARLIREESENLTAVDWERIETERGMELEQGHPV